MLSKTFQATMIMMGQVVLAVMTKNWNYVKLRWKKLRQRTATLMIPTGMVKIYKPYHKTLMAHLLCYIRLMS